MENAVVFGPALILFVFFAILVICFFCLVFSLINKSKNEEWSGEVIDKKTDSFEDMDTGQMQDYFYLLVQVENNGKRKVSLSRPIWEKFSVGDKIHKPKGKLIPEKL